MNMFRGATTGSLWAFGRLGADSIATRRSPQAGERGIGNLNDMAEMYLTAKGGMND